MLKLAVAVAALALFCGQVLASHTFDKELTQNFETCNRRFPPAISHSDLEFYSDEIYWNRLLEIFLTGREDRPFREIQPIFNSPCVTNVNDPYVANQVVAENYTLGTLGIVINLSTTLHADGSVSNTIFFPNSQNPAVSTNWVPVLTNGKSYILQFSCLPEGHFGFQVFTIVPELDAFSIQQIKEYLNKAGFDDVLGVVSTYRASQCTNKP